MISAFSVEVGLILSVILGAVFSFVLLKYLSFLVSRDSYAQVPAVVEEVNTGLEPTPLNMNKHCKFRYEYNGEKYLGFRISPFNFLAPFLFAPSKTVLSRFDRQSRLGEEVTIYVNTKSPNRALASIRMKKMDLLQLIMCLAIVSASLTYIGISTNVYLG